MRGKKKVFTEEEIKYIIDNWGKESPHSMKKKFSCTWYAVVKVAEKHGLEIPKSNEWTKEEIEELKNLSDKYHYTKIAKMMNKSENSIYLKAKKLGITLIQDRREWTKEDEDMLSDLWGNTKIEAIAKKMKRSVFSLKVKAVRMNLGPMIRNNYDVITISDISDILSVSRDRIIRWISLGLKLKKTKLSKNREYYTITLQDLLDFLEKNQGLWDSRNLEKNILGIEPDWLIEKRKKDIRTDPNWYHKWSEEEINKTINLFKNGKNYEEISVIINRSEWSVANLLRNLGYSYMLPQYWKSKEIKYLRENYKDMTYEEIASYLGRTTKAVSAKAEELGFQKKYTKR